MRRPSPRPMGRNEAIEALRAYRDSLRGAGRHLMVALDHVPEDHPASQGLLVLAAHLASLIEDMDWLDPS